MDNVIRDGINYGQLVIIELDGVRFATDLFYSKRLGLQVVAVDGEIPQFNTELTVDVVFPNSGQKADHYVFDNADVRKVAIVLSLHTGNDVQVASSARILATYRGGQLVGEIRSLDSFYSGLTQAEIDASTF